MGLVKPGLEVKKLSLLDQREVWETGSPSLRSG